MKTSLFRLFCWMFLLVSTASSGQEIFKIFETQYKNATLGELIKVADHYFAKKEKQEESKRRHEKEIEQETGEEEGEYFQYKRWEYDMLWHYRLDQVPGNYAASNFKAYYQYQKEYIRTTAISKTTTNDFNGNWRLFGPTNIVAPDRSYAMGRVNAIVADPDDSNILYLGAPAGGLWRSVDQGTNWTPLTDGMPQVGVSGIAFGPIRPSPNPRKIYILTGDFNGIPTFQGLFVSSDAGATWTNTAFPASSVSGTYKIISNPVTNHLLVAAADGIYRSTDEAASWTRTIEGSFSDIEYHPTDPQIVYASTHIYNGGRFYRSEDGGATWTEVAVNASSMTGAIAVTPAKPDRVYFASENNKIYISENKGKNFLTSYSYPSYYSYQRQLLKIAASPTNGDIVQIGSIDATRSTNGGSSWSPSLTNVHVDYQVLTYVGNTLYIGTDGGIYKSLNDGTTASFIGQGLSITQFFRIGGHPNNENYILGAAQDNGGNGIFKNTGIMQPRFGGDGMEIFIDPNDNTIYGSAQYGALKKILSNGTNEYIIPNGVANESGYRDAAFSMDPNNQNTLYAGFKDVYKSTNKAVANSWVNLTIGKISDANLCTNIAVAPSNSNVIYLAKFSGTPLYKSVDGGNSWISMPNLPIPTAIIKCIIVHPKYPERLWALADSFVYYSSNGSSSWTDISGTLPPISVNTLIYQKNSKNRLYVGTDVGVYYKDDDHANWQPFSDGLPCTRVTDFDINYENNLLRAGTYGRGIWETELICDDPAPSTITGAIGGIQFYSASTLTASTNITPNSNISFKANNAITLTEPFAVKCNDNVIFHAYSGTDLCGSSALAPKPLTGTYEGPMPGIIGMISNDASTSAENDFIIFPNPATELANIEFVLKEKNTVELEIYDILGNLVAQPLTFSKLEPGKYEFNLSTNMLTQGVYLVSLHINGKVSQKKLTVVN